ncbi:MAG TPA: RNase adapter RapZ [Candidatus Dormibacteraeota bacterium]|nr:RNase adapter RapZ [Candidatus Dormibacteraeota bacterium]
MSADATPALPDGILVCGPPGSGVPIVAATLTRAGVPAAGWEGGPELHPAADPENLGPDRGPVLVALEASDAACLERSLPPWSERQLSSDVGGALRELAAARDRLFPARLRADLLLDSTHLAAHVLGARVRQLDAFLGKQPATSPAVVVESFGYPRGVPLDLGWCIDARALRNPYWEPALRMLSGLDPEVQAFVLGQPLATRVLDSTEALVQTLIPELQTRSRRVLRLAVGCTGGFHRSVAMTEELGRRLKAAGVNTLIWHRDLPERP